MEHSLPPLLWRGNYLSSIYSVLITVCFDQVKVGSPDEFDYIAELTSLQGQSVAFAPTDDPGFVQIKLNTQYQRLRWKGFLSKAKQLQTNNAAVQHRYVLKKSYGSELTTLKF